MKAAVAGHGHGACSYLSELKEIKILYIDHCISGSLWNLRLSLMKVWFGRTGETFIYLYNAWSALASWPKCRFPTEDFAVWQIRRG